MSFLRNIFDIRLPLQLIRENRFLLEQLIRRNIAVRYRGSVLGLFWSFAQPLMMLSVYTFVFTYVFKARWGINMGDNRAAFAIIMFCGMAVFNIFSESVSGSCTVISSNPNYVKKVLFPIELLPIAQICSTVIFSIVWFALLFAGAAVILKSISWTMLLLPLILLPLAIFCCGCSFFTASVGVYLRDLQHLITVVIQILFFMTPIFYPVSSVPERFQWFLRLNPLCWIVEETRKIFLFGELPNWKWLIIIWLAAIIVFQLGFVWFRKIKRGFANVL